MPCFGACARAAARTSLRLRRAGQSDIIARRIELGEVALDLRQERAVAEALEDLARALQVVPRLDDVAERATEQSVLAVDVGLETRERIGALAQLDRLLEEHETGLVVLHAPHLPHQHVQAGQLVR